MPRQQQQRAPVFAAQHAGDRGVFGRDAFEHLTPFAHPQAFARSRRGEPDRALGIEADAVGRGRTQVGPDATPRQAAVGGDIEGRQAVRRRLGDDEGAAIERERGAVGKHHVGGHRSSPAVGHDEDQRRRLQRGLGKQVEAEMADIGAAFRVDPHIVAMKARQRAQVGMGDECAVRLLPQHALVEHRDDEHPPVGQPAQAGGLARHLCDGVQRARGQVEAMHAPGIEVGQPERAVMPARRLRERQASADQLECHSLRRRCLARSSSCRRNTRRCTLPVVVIGNSAMNSISFGYS